MPVVVSKQDPKKGTTTPTASQSAGQAKQPATVSTPVFVTVIIVVLLIVAFFAYRTFGSSGGGWDNTKTGAPVTAGALGAPPTPKGSGQAASETPGQGATQEAMPGTEMPPNPGG